MGIPLAMRYFWVLFGLVAFFGFVRGTEKHKVIIVGAGVSGFTAAATLLEHNVTDIVVLEASGRIGGRIHTVEYGGVPIDKGAEFVEGEAGNAVYDLVSPYDYLTSYGPLLGPDKTLYVNPANEVFNSTLINRIVDEGFDVFGGESPQDVNGSVADYFFPRMDKILKENKVDGQLSEAIRHLVTEMQEGYSGVDGLSDFGARGYSESKDYEGDIQLKWKKEGYKTIFDFLAKKLPNPSEELPVRNKTILEKQVTLIERGDEYVEVKCADGSSYKADHVIVTPSLGVLKKHAATMFQPPMPAEKTAAIETLGFGYLGKVFLLFPDRWWTNSISRIIPLFSKEDLKNYRESSVHGSWALKTTGFYPVMNHERMLCVWFPAAACRTMESLPEDQIIDGLMELLEKVVGKRFKISRPESILRTTWGNNPYTLGVYSYPTVVSDQQNLNRSHLAEPILDSDGKPVILFAGEATDPHYYGTVHGALGTGQREANYLLNYFNKISTV